MAKKAVPPTGTFVSNNKNPFITAYVVPSTVRTTLESLVAEVTGMTSRAQAGLMNSALRIQKNARANVRPYKYHNRLHDAIQVRVSKANTPTFLRITVGIHARDFAPEGATFERGWRSARGLQPPVEPLVEWVQKRITANPKKARHLAFVIARKMGQRGYSFGERHWLSDAFEAERAFVAPTVERFLATTVGRPPAAGRYMMRQ